jgi:hypothetical protein
MTKNTLKNINDVIDFATNQVETESGTVSPELIVAALQGMQLSR